MMNRITKTGIIVFLKNPAEGRVKTRLASSLGNGFAAEFYKYCAESLFKELRLLSKDFYELFVFYSEKKDNDKIRMWLGENYSYFPQEGSDLGKRIYKAFRTMKKMGYQKVIIIGSDIPDLRADHIAAAEKKLNTADVVIGPCVDGGYYLLGMKKIYRELFLDIPWSTMEVLQRTVAVARQLNLKISTTEELIDVDTESDLLLWMQKKKGNILLKNKIISLQRRTN